MKRIHGLDELFGIRTRVLTVSGQRGIRQANRIRRRACPFAEEADRYVPRSRFSPSTEGHQRPARERETRTSRAVALIAGAVTVTFQMACPFLSRCLDSTPTRAKSPNRGRGIRPNHRHFVFHAPEESRRRTYSTPFSSGILN